MKKFFTGSKREMIAKWLYRALFLLALSYPIFLFIGMRSLANAFLMGVLQTGAAITAFVICVHLTKMLTTLFTKKAFPLKKEKKKQEISAYWIQACLHIVLTFSLIILFLLIWGVYPHTVFEFLNTIFFKGFKVGSSDFSVLYLAKAIAIYFVVYYFFRLVLFIIEKHAFPYMQLDRGTKSAISTIVGYAGFVLAIVLAVYSLGLSGASLAFIVSAFTFGISFGLKEIFSNFISGLILLIERPIKVGDWVNVGSESGVVKRIRLRSTTVETFDKKTLLVPNSNFITSTVSNDLYNPISRAVIEIECGYDDDPVQVQELLLQVARTYEGIMDDPAPSVVFTGFNASGLGFNLRFFCSTTEKATLMSNIRFEIIKTFREHNIEIPYPKQDIYIKEFSKA